MDLAAIARSPIGTLVPIAGFDPRTASGYEHAAFVPDPLPRTIELQTATWRAVTQAEAALARLDQASHEVPEPALLRRPAIRREAQSTSALEGTFAPFSEVLESELEDPAQMSLEVREILNYVLAAEQGFDWVQDRPLTVGLVASLQRTLVRGTAGEQSDSGGLRDRQVVVGQRSGRIVDARFVPPPPGDGLRDGLEQWVAWVERHSSELPAVVRTAMAHYQFETLHPFSDGNGRIGRLAIVLQLLRYGVLREPVLVVSPWFEARRDAYQDGLLSLSRTGDWDAWVQFFATGIAAAADTTRERIEHLLAWRDFAIERARRAGLSGVAERLAGELIGAPVLTAPRVARDHGVSQQGAMKALRRLAAIELVREDTRHGRRRFFADVVMEILTR